jgi:putative membrane-bound dehydrogenase-like protein
VKPEVATFKLKAGFKVELVAASPSVASPVAMAFDEDARLFVAEMRDYPNKGSETPHLGQIRVLEDLDGEGVFSSSTIFATNLPLPSAVACYGRGVFVAAAPNIFFLEDTDGNGVADVRRVVFTGFGDTNSLNANAVPHSFYWGMDNRIYGASGGAAITIRPVGVENAITTIATGRDFSFDPRALEISAEAGLALSGMTRNDWGTRFLCSNAKPFQVEVMEERYAARNPYFVPASLVEDMGGPAVPIFRPGAPAARRAAKVPGTNVHTATWLANARGAVMYRGSLFPSNYYGNIFVADADARVIHRGIVRELATAYTVERAPDERDTEFLISSDPSFRPAQIVNGPDGALYVADMASGGDNGRIYRISPTAFRASKPVKLSLATTRELVALLAHTNSFHRDTAARLIYEKRDPEAVPLLASMAANSRLPLARGMALHALAGAGALTDVQTSHAMGDPDWRVRRVAASLVEGFAMQGNVSDSHWARLRSLATDPNFFVRFQAALTSGAIDRPDKPVLLRNVLARDPSNPWVQSAVLASAHSGGAGPLLSVIAAEPRIPDGVMSPVLMRLAEMIGTGGIMQDVQSAIDFIVGPQVSPQLAMSLTGSLGDGLRRTRSSLRLADAGGRLAPLFALALNVAANRTMAESYRVEAIRVLGTGPYTMDDGGAVLLRLIGSNESPAIQSAALRAISFYASPEQVPGVLGRWQSIPTALRGQAVAALISRTDNVPVVLTLIENGNIPVADVLPWQINLFRTWLEPAVRQKAVRLFGPFDPNGSTVVERLRTAADLVGVPSRGQAIYQANCSACHNIGGPWNTAGPDLAGIKVLGRDAILQALLAPSMRIAPGHLTSVVTTASGETLVGTVGRETAQSIVVRTQNGITVWPRMSLEDVQVQKWSLMPDGLENTLNAQGIADLIQLLLTFR